MRGQQLLGGDVDRAHQILQLIGIECPGEIIGHGEHGHQLSLPICETIDHGARLEVRIARRLADVDIRQLPAATIAFSFQVLLILLILLHHVRQAGGHFIQKRSDAIPLVVDQLISARFEFGGEPGQRALPGDELIDQSLSPGVNTKGKANP